MGRLDKEMTGDLEGITDAPRNSLFAGAAVLFGILGLFAIVEPVFSLFSLASIASGLLVLVFAKTWDLSRLSIHVALGAIFIGLFCGLAGIIYKTTRDGIIHQKAVEVASMYLQALADGDRTLAIKMVGLPQVVEDSEAAGPKASREQKAVRGFLADTTIQEVLQLGNEASWKSTGIRGKVRDGIVIEMSVGFVDEKATNTRPIVVTVKMVPPTKYSVETRNQWLVTSIDQAPL